MKIQQHNTRAGSHTPAAAAFRISHLAQAISIALATLSLSMVVPSAMAQTTAPASQVARRLYQIDAGPLGNVLAQFAALSAVPLSFDPATLAGQQSAGLHGSYSVQDGFALLLNNSGYELQEQGNGAYSLRRRVAPADGASTPLPAVNVKASSDTVSDSTSVVATQSSVGTKSSTPLIETPQAISVVTRQQMNAQGATSVAQALDYTSGLVSEQRGVNTAGFEYITGRGFQLEKYLDGMRMPNVAYNMPSYEPYNLERIEVLHGPASVLYGQTYPGGLINLVSKRAPDQAFGEVQLQVGTHATTGAAFDVGGPVNDDGSLLYRVTGSARQSNSQVNNVGEERFSIAPTLTWKIDRATSLTLLMNYQNDPAAGYYNFVPALGTVLPNPNGKISTSLNPGEPSFDHHARTQYSLGYLFEHQFNDNLTVRQGLRYTHITDQLEDVFANGLAADNRTLNRYAFFNNENLHQLTTDTQIEAKFSTGAVKHTALLGLDYQRITYDELYGFGFTVAGLDAYNPVYGTAPVAMPTASGSDDATMQQTGIYLQDQMSLGNWRWLLSGRKDWSQARDIDRIGGSNTVQNDSAYTWRTGLVYLFDNGFAPYASYATSFQPQIGTAFGGSVFKPTTGQQYEAGVKYQPSGYSGFITASVFDLTQQNVVTADTAAGHTGFSVQTGEIRSRGLELEAHVSPMENLDLVASYTLLDNVVTKSNETTSLYDPDQGKHPTGIPRNTAALWANYSFKKGDLAGLTVGGGVRYVGSSYATNTNVWGITGVENTSSEIPSYTLLDASLKYDFSPGFPAWKGVTLAVSVRNLLNKQYVAYCQSAALCQFGNGRSGLATLSYHW